MKVLKNEPMKQHTSFRVGGPASAYAVPESVDELQKLLCFLREEELPYEIIGNGTNLLVSDRGIEHVVIEIGRALEGIELLKDTSGDAACVRVMAGTLLSRAAQFAAAHSLQGMEALKGIPGTVGGAVTMNAGAYGTEIKDVLVSAEVLTDEGELRSLAASELDLSYRHSCITEKDYAVVSATFRLSRGNPEEIRARMEDFQRRRREKQPLEKASAGSTFKRPAGAFAGKLIEDCGLRGFRHGGAQVSEKHCGFVVNDGTARAADIYWLIAEIRKRVLLEQHVELEPEVKIWGSF